MIRHSIRFTAKITNMMVVFSVFTQYDAGLLRGFGEACCLHHQGDRTLFRYIHLTQTRRKHSATRYSMYYEVTFWRVRLMFMPPRLSLYHFTRRQRLYGDFMSPVTTTLTWVFMESAQQFCPIITKFGFSLSRLTDHAAHAYSDLY